MRHDAAPRVHIVGSDGLGEHPPLVRDEVKASVSVDPDDRDDPVRRQLVENLEEPGLELLVLTVLLGPVVDAVAPSSSPHRGPRPQVHLLERHDIDAQPPKHLGDPVA